MSAPDVTALLEIFRERWSSRLTMALAALLAFAIALLAFAVIDLGRLSLWHWLVAALAAAIVVTAWVITNRVPTTPRGKTGIIVAILTEDHEYATRLRSDFVRTLGDLLASPQAKRTFALVEYSSELSAQVKDGDSATKFLVKSRARLALYGTARSRLVAGRDQHVLDLRGCVLHAPIPHSVSNRFGQEMSEVFPTRLRFDRENDVLSFQLTSEVMSITTRYIVGIAALLSRELTYAEELLLDVEQMTQGPLRAFPTVARIRQLVPQRLARLYTLKAGPVLDAYFIKRERVTLELSEQLLAQVERWDPGSYGMKVGRALCAFALRRDIATAWRYVNACRGTPDGTWRYSGAFLHAYVGQLRDARKWYRLAFQFGSTNETVPVQTEEFMYLVIDEEPDRYQLHYCIGLVNLEAKRDLASAHRAFSQFLAACQPNRFQDEQDLAKGYIRQIDDQLRRAPQ